MCKSGIPDAQLDANSATGNASLSTHQLSKSVIALTKVHIAGGSLLAACIIIILIVVLILHFINQRRHQQHHNRVHELHQRVRGQTFKELDFDE